jgi:hypothetical protein
MKPSPTVAQPASQQGQPAQTAEPTSFRLDPSPSKMFSWLEWQAEAAELVDESSGRTLRPAGPLLHVRFRSTGAEWEYYPVSLAEARQVMNPGPEFDFSIGRAFGEVVKAHKSGRMVRSGERMETRRQREVEEQRAGKRWLA